MNFDREELCNLKSRQVSLAIRSMSGCCCDQNQNKSKKKNTFECDTYRMDEQFSYKYCHCVCRCTHSQPVSFVTWSSSTRERDGTKNGNVPMRHGIKRTFLHLLLLLFSPSRSLCLPFSGIFLCVPFTQLSRSHAIERRIHLYRVSIVVSF